MADPDSDTLLNLQELAFGTDSSTSDASRPAFPNLVPVANDGEPKPARFSRITVLIN